MAIKLQPPIPPELLKLGFHKPPDVGPRRIIMVTEAREKCGKTHFALTAPGPIGIISQDVGTRGVVERFQAKGKTIWLKEHIPATKMMEVVRSAAKYDQEWSAIQSEYTALLGSKSIRTIIVDTGTDFWESLRLARFGKLTQVMPHHYGPVNNEMREMVRAGFETDKNVIWIHRVKKEYKTSKDGKDNWTGNFERAGFGDIGYLGEMVLRHTRRVDEDGVHFGAQIVDSRLNGQDTIGQTLEDDMSTFPMVASLAFPDTSPDDWE